MKEIERKWILTKLPGDLPAGVRILQAYVSTSSGEVRIRKIGTKYRMTVKGDGTISRDEAEAPIPRWAFDLLWPRLTARIVKTRHSIPYHGRTVEIDVFQPPLAPLVMAEVEFPSMKLARAFRVPRWFGTAHEVTEDPRYKNKALAVKGLPPEDRRTMGRQAARSGQYEVDSWAHLRSQAREARSRRATGK